MKTIVMNGTGGREMLDYVERPDPVAGPGQAPVEIAFAGVNFMDIGVRQGTVWNEMPNPKILGVEGVGRVVADSDGVMSLPKSIKIGYATFRDHIHTPDLLRARTAQLFDWIADGRLRIRIGGEYPLADAAKAHADMESRRTTGKLLLVP
jgi:NADPH:quinone reductase-like Zn-dependent oxidoreductase